MTNPYADPFGNPPPLPAALRPPVPPPGGIMPIVGSYGQALRLLVRHPVFWALGLATGSVRGLPGVLDGGDVISILLLQMGAWCLLSVLGLLVLVVIGVDNQLDAGTIRAGATAGSPDRLSFRTAWEAGAWYRGNVFRLNLLITVTAGIWGIAAWLLLALHRAVDGWLVVGAGLLSAGLGAGVLLVTAAELGKRAVVLDETDWLSGLTFSYRLIRRRPGLVLGFLCSQAILILLLLIGWVVISIFFALLSGGADHGPAGAGAPSPVGSFFGSLLALGLRALLSGTLFAANSLVWTAFYEQVTAACGVPSGVRDMIYQSLPGRWPWWLLGSGSALLLGLAAVLSMGLGVLPPGTPADWQAARRAATATAIAQADVRATVAAHATATSWAAQWATFAGPDGDFTVELPGRPAGPAIPAPADDPATTFAVTGPDGLYSVSYTDLPAAEAGDRDIVFATLPERWGRGWQLRAMHAVSRGPMSGREVILGNNGDQILHGQAYLIGQRLYRLTVIQPQANDESTNRTRFFASFHPAPQMPAAVRAGWPTLVPSPTPIPNPTDTPTATGTPPTASPTSTPFCEETWRGLPPTPAGLPDLSQVPDRKIWAVLPVAAGGVWAAGQREVQQHSVPVLLHGDGTTWTAVPHALAPDESGALLALAGSGPADVWAAGQRGDQPLIEHWDGTAWRAIPPDQLPSASGTIYGLAVLAPGDVWAVGMRPFAQTESRPLLWHGTRAGWQAVPLPAGQVNGGLFAISGSNPRDIWAAGYQWTGYHEPWLLHWDGTAWRATPAPGSGLESGGVIQGIAAVAPTEAWAVGRSELAGPLLLRWDGQAWAAWDPPSPYTMTGLDSNFAGALSNVVARAPDDVWVLGVVDPGTLGDPFLAHWDSHRWKSFRLPFPAQHNSWDASRILSSNTWHGLALMGQHDVWVGGPTIQHVTGLPQPCAE